MKPFLPVVNILFLLVFLALTTVVFSLPANAYSYGDHVEINGYMYSSCTGSGNFGYTNGGNYYVCDANNCGGGRIYVAPSLSGCASSGVFYANQSSMSPIGIGPTGSPTHSPTPTPGPCERGTANGVITITVTDTRTGTAYPGTLTAHSISSGNCSSCCNKDDGRTTALTNGAGQMTIYSPKTAARSGVEIYASDLPNGYECVQCSGSTIVPSGGSSTINLTVHSICPYTEVKNYFQSSDGRKSTDYSDNRLVLLLDGTANIHTEGRRTSDGVWIDLPSNDTTNGGLSTLTRVEDSTGSEGADPDIPASIVSGYNPFWPDPGYTFRYGESYQVSTNLANSACSAVAAAPMATLKVNGCPYTGTSVQIAPSRTDPLIHDYFEEYSDQGKGFCSYASAPGSCTGGDLPLQVKNGSLLTHASKNLFLKVLHYNADTGVLIDGATDANIIARDPTAVIRCFAKTNGEPLTGYECQGHADGTVNFRLDLTWTTTAALLGGGAAKDLYTVETTTNVTNEQTGEVQTVTRPACTDTDNIYVDACLYDSTQAYMRQYNSLPNLPYSHTLKVEKNDKVVFAGFHEVPDPAQMSYTTSLYPPSDILKHLHGPYGFDKNYNTDINPSILDFKLAGGLPLGTYNFDVSTQRIKGGVPYNLDKSEFCTDKTTFTVQTKTCTPPPPSTDPVDCCPAKPQSGTWSPGNVLSQLLSLIPNVGIPFRVKLGVESLETTTDTGKIADYLFGQDISGVFNPGSVFRAMPPYELVEKFPDETAQIDKRRETARYSFGLQTSASQELNSGPISDLAPATFAAERLQKYNARPLRPEDVVTSAEISSKQLALANDITTSVLGISTPICTEVKPAFRSESAVCFTEAAGADISATDFLTLVQSNFSSNNLFKMLAEKTDWLGRYLAGQDTSGVTNLDGAYERDTAYHTASLAEKYLRPGEGVLPDASGDTQGNFTLGFQYKNPATNEWTWVPGLKIALPAAQLALRYVGAAKNTISNIFVPKSTRPGEEPPTEPLPPGYTPTPTPTPTVTPIPPGNIPHTDTTVAITASRKEDIMTYVEGRWPASPIRSEWDYVYNTGRNYGYNPAFIIALWMEESGASGLSPFWDLGCGRGPQNNLPSQMACMNGLPYKNTSWAEFACRFADGHYPCTFAAHPNFILNLTGFYRCVTQSSCSLF